jgi:hypothetical protein
MAEIAPSLHYDELFSLLDEVDKIAAIAREWADWMGFCPDALFKIAAEGSAQAVASVESGNGDTYENALGSLYLAGFVLGVLAERKLRAPA